MKLLACVLLLALLNSSVLSYGFNSPEYKKCMIGAESGCAHRHGTNVAEKRRLCMEARKKNCLEKRDPLSTSSPEFTSCYQAKSQDCVSKFSGSAQHSQLQKCLDDGKQACLFPTASAY